MPHDQAAPAIRVNVIVCVGVPTAKRVPFTYRILAALIHRDPWFNHQRDVADHGHVLGLQDVGAASQESSRIRDDVAPNDGACRTGRHRFCRRRPGQRSAAREKQPDRQQAENKQANGT